tara:strand:- start:22 stop:597 length:576 start_codon:yes stop_codon:yes gene_type:complete
MQERNAYGNIVIPPFNYTTAEDTACEFLKGVKIKNFINVGFHGWSDIRKHWWINICNFNGIEWKIVEVYKPNVDNAISEGCPQSNIINLNIKHVSDLPDADCLMFWHGPEHMEKDEFLQILPLLEDKYRMLLFGMPLGPEPQGEAYGNPFEKHVSSWQEYEWRELGYEVRVVYKNRSWPHITAWKINEGEE